MYKIGVDLGGTNIATGVVDDNYRIIGKYVAKTHFESSATEIVNSIASSIYTAIDAAKVKLSDIEEIGVGIPGAVDSVCGIVKYSCNLDFHETPVARLLSEKSGGQYILKTTQMQLQLVNMLQVWEKCKDFCGNNLGYRSR